MPAFPIASRWSRFCPWRRAWPGWLLAVGFLAAGLPAFFRMPPWCDLTLYEMAARAIMTGGVHYRDVFDTNTPGFVWLLVIVRRLFGPDLEAVWAVDLAVVAAVVALIYGFARRAGANAAGLAWFAAGVAFFYPFTSEFCHAQRDVWMMLPALAAVHLRMKRLGRGVDFRAAVVEGAIWGIAVWIKPHVGFIAACVWLYSVRRMVAGSPRPWRAAGRDACGYVAGGGLVLFAGCVWLAATGTWKPFVEVWQKWNPYYVASMWEEFGTRLTLELSYFPPLSGLLPVGLILAVANLIDARPWAANPVRPGPVGRHLPAWLYDAGADDAHRSGRGLLAVLLLAWATQAVVMQKSFHYVHVPEILLMLGVAAVNRWPVVPLGMLYAAACGGVWLYADRHPAAYEFLDDETPSWCGEYLAVPRHPVFQPARNARWSECLRPGLPGDEYRARRDAVALLGGTFASIDAAEIHDVAEELRRRGVRDGDVICWHDSPHAVYLELGLKPHFRFMHVTTAFVHGECYERMKRELIKAMPGTKYVVSDLQRAWTYAPAQATAAEFQKAGPDLLPPIVPAGVRKTFPFRLRAVYRSGGGRGRFLIHEVDPAVPFGPYDDCYYPLWTETGRR